MGHDILGFNRVGEEVAYARFSMGNHNAIILYQFLDAFEYYAGVSGSGRCATYSRQHIEKALNAYNQFFKNDVIPYSNLPWDQRQMLDFIQNCLTTAKKEGSVEVYYG